MNKDIKTICEEHLYKGRIVEKLVFDEAIDEEARIEKLKSVALSIRANASENQLLELLKVNKDSGITINIMNVNF